MGKDYDVIIKSDSYFQYWIEKEFVEFYMKFLLVKSAEPGAWVYVNINSCGNSPCLKKLWNYTSQYDN